MLKEVAQAIRVRGALRKRGGNIDHLPDRHGALGEAVGERQVRLLLPLAVPHLADRQRREQDQQSEGGVPHGQLWVTLLGLIERVV